MENKPFEERTTAWSFGIAPVIDDEAPAPVLRADERLLEELLAELATWHSATERVDERAGSGLGVHATAARCLEILHRSGALSAGELAARLDVSASGTTPVLDRLEEAGLVERVRPTRGDRRRVTVQLTKSGRSAAAGFWDDLHDRLARLAGEYSKGEVRLLRDFLRRASAILDGRELQPAPDEPPEQDVVPSPFANRETIRMAPSPRRPAAPPPRRVR